MPELAHWGTIGQSLCPQSLITGVTHAGQQ